MIPAPMVPAPTAPAPTLYAHLFLKLTFRDDGLISSSHEHISLVMQQQKYFCLSCLCKRCKLRLVTCIAHSALI
jgi:hypothetical protein